MADKPSYLGLLNAVSTLAVLKYFRHGDLAHDVGEEDEA